MLEITLNIEGKEKKFEQAKITLGAMRRLAEMDKNIKALQGDESNQEDNGLEIIDEMSFTIVALFKNQFTFDELIYGLEFETMEEFNEIVEGIFNQVADSSGKPSPAKKAPAKRPAK